MPKPKILLIEDRQDRHDLKQLLEEEFELTVHSPDSFEAMRKSVLLRTYDGALSDIRLVEWQVNEGLGKRINGHTVEDGIDIIDFYHMMHENAAVALHSSYFKEPQIKQKIADLDFDPIKIYKVAGSDEETFVESFSPFIAATRKAFETNQTWMLKADEAGQMTFNERLAAYERACCLNQTWINTTLDTYGELSWGILCEGEIELFGAPLPDSQILVNPELKIVPSLDQAALDALEAQTGLYPFTLWNIGSPAHLAGHFQLAGTLLGNLPASQPHYFSFAMATLIEQAYESEPGKAVLQWARHLTLEGQIELARRISKRETMGGAFPFEQFQAECRELSLPSVVEILKARVDAIDEETNTAYVELSRLDSYRALTMEPFKFSVLRDNGLKDEDQEFELTVYKYPTGPVAMNVRLILPA